MSRVRNEAVKAMDSTPLSLVKTQKGNFSLKVSSDDGRERVLHSLYDPEKEARDIVDAFHFDGRGILVIFGLGLGYHLSELLKRFPKSEVIVVEMESEIYDMAREYGGINVLESKVRYLVGLTADSVVKEITRHQMRVGIVPLSLFQLPSAIAVFPDYYAPIVSVLSRTVSLRLWEKFRYPKLQSEKARVAIIGFGYFLTREVEGAVKRLGHDVAQIPIRKGEEGDAIVARIMEAIVTFKPDFFLTMNHLGFDEDGVLTDFLRSIEMPVASWYVDSPDLILKEHGRNVSPYTTLFLWDRGYLGAVESMGFEDTLYLPLATDETVFTPHSMARNKLKGGRYPIGFVGNSMVEPATERLGRIDERLHSLIERCADRMANHGSSLDGVFGVGAGAPSAEELSWIGDERKCDIEAAILWKATLIYRLSCINELAAFDVTIHGDGGWKSLLKGYSTVLPPLDYYRELPHFYRSCQINFNATNLQMGEAVNQRVFDVPATGGFILTDHQEAIEELFDVGREVVTYHERGEIRDLAAFYLKNSSARREVARRGRERVLKEHTYTARLKTIISTMRGRYRQ